MERKIGIYMYLNTGKNVKNKIQKLNIQTCRGKPPRQSRTTQQDTLRSQIGLSQDPLELLNDHQ